MSSQLIVASFIISGLVLCSVASEVDKSASRDGGSECGMCKDAMSMLHDGMVHIINSTNFIFK